jgi:HAE1 family hydrophobic/amphiphilic exporter-1
MRSLLAAVVARPVGTVLVLVAVVALGAVSLVRLPLAAMPPLQRPVVRVEGSAPGLGMEQLEADLARRLERALLVLPGSDTLVTWCRDGLVAAEVGFRWGVDPERARLEVTEALDSLRPPAGVALAWRAAITPAAGRPAIILGVGGARPLTARSGVAEDLLLPALAAIPGVARVEVVGGRQLRTVVRPDPARLFAVGLSPGAFRTALGRALRHRRLGEVVVDGEDAEVVVAAAGDAPAAVAAIPLALGGGGNIPLDEVAEVRREPWPDHGSFLVAGLPAVGVAVYLEADANALAVNRHLKRAIDETVGRATEGLTVIRLSDSLAALEAAIRALAVAAVVGALVAGLILALAVRRLGGLLVLLLVIPLSLLAALPVFEAFGLGLNLVSMVGMALAVGMLVDAAVVVLEACMGRRGPGWMRAVEGTSAVARAIIASAVTTAVVFVPALYLRHLAAAMFRQLAVALMVTLIASLVFALLAVPVAAARMVGEAVQGEGRLRRVYRRSVAALSARAGWSVAAVLLAVLLCWLAAAGMPQQLLAGETTSALEVAFSTPWQPWQRSLDASGLDLLAGVRRSEEQDMLAAGLEASSGPPLPAGFWYLPEPRTQAELDRLRAALQGALPGLKVHRAGPAGGLLEALPLRRLAVDVSGRDRLQVAAAAQLLRAAFHGRGIAVVEDLPPAVTSLEVRPSELGVLASSDLDAALADAMAAVERPELGPVRLDESRLAGMALAGVPVVVGRAGPRPLAALAELEAVERPAALVRHRGEPAVRLLVGEATANVTAVEDVLEATVGELPEGVEARAAGGVLDWREARQELALAVALGLVLVFLVLAAIYESLRLPLTVFAVLPFAALGGLLAQRLAGQGLDLGSWLGFVLLTGLAVNNGVLLLDRLRDGSSSPALWSRRAAARLRPVLVTTLTTLATLAPVAFAGGAGASLRATLARTAFGGLLLSAPAALFVLPPLARLLLPRQGGRDGTERG